MALPTDEQIAQTRILQQHHEIATRMNSFSARLLERCSSAELADALLAVISEVSLHFGFEEGVMEEGGYADFEHHRRQHLAIVIELGMLLDRIEANLDPAELVRNVDFVTHWYEQHIVHSDQLFEAWLDADRSLAD